MYQWDEKEKNKGKGEEITTGSLDVWRHSIHIG